MLERQHEERHERRAVRHDEDATSSLESDAGYYSALDQLIQTTMSSDSEAFLQQSEQENGQ